MVRFESKPITCGNFDRMLMIMIMKTSKLRIALVQTLLLNKSIFSRSIQHHTLPRLFIPNNVHSVKLDTGIHVPLSTEQIHYVNTVLRLGGKRQSKNKGSPSPQPQVRIFNGIDGEWVGCMNFISKKEITIECIEQIRSQNKNDCNNGSNCWVMFAPVQQPKRLKYMIEKCTEMGASRFVPIVTERTQLNNIKWNALVAKWRAIAIEASEQCERLDVPVINFNVNDEEKKLLSDSKDDSNVALNDLKQLLHHWEEEENNRLLYICCERSNDNDFLNVMNRNTMNKNIAFVVGPEGGWSDNEFQLIRDKVKQNDDRDNNSIQLISLGDNVLRAETAAIASVAGWSLWQSSI